MREKITASIKIVLSGLLFYAIATHGYSFYMRFRLFSTIGLIVLSVMDKTRLKWLFVGMAVILNPIFKLHLSKPDWQILDALMGTILICSALYDIYKNKSPLSKG